MSINLYLNVNYQIIDYSYDFINWMIPFHWLYQLEQHFCANLVLSEIRKKTLSEIRNLNWKVTNIDIGNWQQNVLCYVNKQVCNVLILKAVYEI